MLIVSVAAQAQKISEMPRVTGAALPGTALFPFVDTTQTPASNRNRAILASQLKIYFGALALADVNTRIDSIIANWPTGGSTDSTIFVTLTRMTDSLVLYALANAVSPKMDSIRVNNLLALRVLITALGNMAYADSTWWLSKIATAGSTTVVLVHNFLMAKAGGRLPALPVGV
jgi:hypothetical protein